MGAKINLIKRLNAKGCNVISFPYNTSKEEIMKYKPNGLFISSGPGNPLYLDEVVENAIDIFGYNKVNEQETIEIGVDDNVINFYYTKRTDLSYTVNYLEKDTNAVLAIEWSENIENALPENYIRIEIDHGKTDESRILKMSGDKIYEDTWC